MAKEAFRADSDIKEDNKPQGILSSGIVYLPKAYDTEDVFAIHDLLGRGVFIPPYTS